MKKMISLLRFLSLVMFAFMLSFTLGVLLTDSANACMDVTIFGGLLLALWFGAFDR